MKILIAEDDFASRKTMLNLLSRYGECDITVDGKEAIEAFKMALDDGKAYDLVCLDIMMPELDGYKALAEIRKIEENLNLSQEKRAKIVMTSALNEGRNVKKAFELGCEAYAGKPIDQGKLIHVLGKFGLVQESCEY